MYHGSRFLFCPSVEKERDKVSLKVDNKVASFDGYKELNDKNALQTHSSKRLAVVNNKIFEGSKLKRNQPKGRNQSKYNIYKKNDAESVNKHLVFFLLLKLIEWGY